MSVEWNFLVTLNEQLRPLKDPVEIQEVAVRLIGKHLHASRVHYAHIDGDEFVISRSYVDGVPPLAGRGPVAVDCVRGTLSRQVGCGRDAEQHTGEASRYDCKRQHTLVDGDVTQGRQ